MSYLDNSEFFDAYIAHQDVARQRQRQMDSGMMNQLAGLSVGIGQNAWAGSYAPGQPVSQEPWRGICLGNHEPYKPDSRWYYNREWNFEQYQSPMTPFRLSGDSSGQLIKKTKKPSRLRRLCRWLKAKWNNRFQPRKEGLKKWKEIWT